MWIFGRDIQRILGNRRTDPETKVRVSLELRKRMLMKMSMLDQVQSGLSWTRRTRRLDYVQRQDPPGRGDTEELKQDPALPNGCS